MYAFKNRVQLIGNLGGKPEIKKTENGKTQAGKGQNKTPTTRG